MNHNKDESLLKAGLPIDGRAVPYPSLLQGAFEVTLHKGERRDKKYLIEQQNVIETHPKFNRAPWFVIYAHRIGCIY